MMRITLTPGTTAIRLPMAAMREHRATAQIPKTLLIALNDAHFGGFSDWRLPTIKELTHIVNYDIPYPGPTINTGYFPEHPVVLFIGLLLPTPTLPALRGAWTSTTARTTTA